MDEQVNLPEKKVSKLRKVLAAIFIVLVTFFIGFYLGQRNLKVNFTRRPVVTISRELPSGKEDLDFSLFWRVWDTLFANYIDKAKLIEENMVYGAIRGMVAAIDDPYTVFLPPEENKVVQEDLQGSLEGVGIQIGFRGSRLVVIAPLPGTPAEKAGLEAGDFLVGIKDEAKDIDMGTVGISLHEAVKAIRGPSGTTVTLTALREGEEEPLVFDIVREQINVPSVTLSFVGEGEDIAHIKLSKFAGETNFEWDKIIRDILLKPAISGVILDVRNNPGGFLQGSVDIASEFVASGETVVIEENAQGERAEFKVERIGRMLNMPIVVLVNEGSASASEILAGALRDINGTLLIGEKTFGKGTIQEPLQVNGGAALHITTSKWLTPSEYWVDEKGLEPDFILEDNPDTEEDEQLLEAIRVLTS